MREDPVSIPPRLEAWLEIATHGLCDEARRRIRSEISDHYESALEAATVSGIPTRAAEDSALSTLGDPAEAGRSLRRTNLTRFQAALVRDHRGRPSRGVLVLHLAILASGVGSVVAFAEPWAHPVVGSLALVLMAAATAVMHLVAPRSYERGHVKTAVLASALAHWAFYAAICVGLPFSTGVATSPFAAAFYGVILLLLLALYVPLIGKLRGRGPGPSPAS